jgi:hypothetical protein
MTGAPWATPVIELQTLNEAPLSERDDGTAGDNEVVDNPDVNETQGIAEPRRNQLVRLTRLSDP